MFLNPKNIFTALDHIDQTSPSYTLNRQASLRRVFWTLATVSVCLLIIHYMKYSNTFAATLDLFSNEPFTLRRWVNGTGFGELIGYGWWTFWHFIGYVCIPFIVIKGILKTSILDMGWRFNDTAKHWKGYLILLSVIFVCIFVVSFGQSFINHYPFYKQAQRSWFDLISWEIMYLAQFVFLEFFFRGFMINALRPALGANAVWVMCVPYLMIHLPKLWPEATGAILFGLFLGILALQSRSIWGGFFVHAGIAVGMDLTSLIKQGKLPTQWWPL